MFAFPTAVTCTAMGVVPVAVTVTPKGLVLMTPGPESTVKVRGKPVVEIPESENGVPTGSVKPEGKEPVR